MKKLLFVLAAILAPAIASAQESYNVPATAPQVVVLTDGIKAFNIRTCRRLVQPIPCTQAQACVAANAAGGASCTAAQARAARARIYVNSTQPGREEFVQFEFNAAHFNDLQQLIAPMNLYLACVKWQTDNQTARDSSCTAAGITPPCTLFGTTCQ